MSTAKVVGIFDFYGMTLSIAEFESVRYVQLRPIVESLGLFWKRSREAVLREENTRLYGIKMLSVLPLDTFFPDILTHPCTKTMRNATILPACKDKNGKNKGNLAPCGAEIEDDFTPYGVKNEVTTAHLCIRLDRVHLYLARVNTASMRAVGKEHAADQLLRLQQEWAEVLHRYEAGEVVHKSKIQKDLIALVNAQAKTSNPAQKAAFTAMIDDVLAELGYLPPVKQAELFGGAQ